MSYVVDGVTYYTVRFLNNAGTDLLGTCDVKAGGDATTLAPSPETIEGMGFVGWNVDITCVTEDMTVRPVYQSASQTIYYTVRFLNKDGTDIWSIQTVEEGNDAIAPNPERVSGFIFIGWSTAFTNVHSDLTVYPRYREIPPHPRLNFYERLEDDNPGNLKKTYMGVNACMITEKLSGECTIDIKLLTRLTENSVSINDYLELEGLVFTITEIRKNISNGLCYTQMLGEHVSYILNNEKYNVSAFDRTGTPEELLRILLQGTPFTVGTVDVENTVTLRINKEATRRACIMQLIALADCEIEYYGYTISIRAHRGSETAIDVVKEMIVQDVSYSYNVSEETTNYTLSLYQKGKLELGDNLYICFPPLGIDTESRIVGIDWNPFNYKEVNITVGNYIPTLNDSLYELINTVQDITTASAKYTVEFGEMIGNGSFYFTRAYRDKPYFHIHTDDGSEGQITLNRKNGSAFGSYVGATLSGVNSTTTTLIVFYCTVPDE